MLLSIFTPAHHTRYLDDLRESLKKQTLQEFEWVVLMNGGATYENNDPRVKVIYDDYQGYNQKYIGRLKNEACKHCTGDILVEMDFDDELTTTCLEEIQKAFESDKDIVFVYSNSVNVNFNNDGKDISGRTRTNYFGREFRPYTYRGVEVFEAIQPIPDPQNLSIIYFAPNHVRAYRAKTYRDIGGHDVSLEISDDHDIGLRMYLAGKVYWIDKPLYIYKVHGDNTRLKHIESIQHTMRSCFDKYIVPMMMKWSKNNGLHSIDLGGAIDSPEGLLSVDRHNADIVTDLNGKRDIEDNSVGFIRAHDVIEHLQNPINTMNEAYRVLVHGGIIQIQVPSDCGIFTEGKYYAPYGASCDPTHVTKWNARSFKYYTEPVMRKYIEPECNCKFVVIKPVQEVLIYGLPYVTVTLMADKGGVRYHGENFWRESVNEALIHNS